MLMLPMGSTRTLLSLSALLAATSPLAPPLSATTVPARVAPAPPPVVAPVDPPSAAADPAPPPAVAPDPADDPRRDFDFWVGEWAVANRHMDDAGAWHDGNTTRARITPVLGGAAVLEEWAGPFRGAFMNGFSLRAWDPDTSRWALLLFWTTDGNGGFGRLHGAFRHGRGEFFAPDSGPRQTRYTFSDALDDSVRWDSATTQDGGVTWKTDWIMEFTRTRPADEVTQDELFATDWTSGELSPHAEARELDWLLGRWEGTQTDDGGAAREARLRAKLLDKDVLVLDVLETRADGSAPWSGRLAVRGWTSASGGWEAWSLTDDDTRLRPSRGTVGEGGVLFERVVSAGEEPVSETLRRVDDDHLRIEEAVGIGRTRRVVRVTELERAEADS